MTIVPRLTKSSILQTTHTKEEQQWDPHIDAFDILRAKLNGITRSMQELHVQELFYDEFLKKKKNEFHSKRHSLTDDYKQSIDRGHRRIQSFSYTEEIAKEEAVEEEISWDNPTSSYLNEEEEKTASVASPNLTALFVTTNNLIHSKLDELSETASIHSESEDASDWRRQFLNLVTLCIQQSEELESLSVDILYAEQRVRELMFLNQSIHEQFHEREKQYEERIRECQEVAKQQLLMIDSLEELMADINMKLESTQKKPEGVKQPEGNEEEEEREQKRREEEEDRRWDFSKAISELLKMEDKLDIVHKMRWDVGMFVGGGVGTGHIIHSFENRLHGIDLMIAGSGMTNEPIDEQEEEEEQSNFISSSIQHIRFHQHQYVLHLTQKDKQNRFVSVPKDRWVPDEQADMCQFPMCNSRFSLFKRRHHCRRCGQVICQKHSANQLPLFSTNSKFEWSRVCDACFQYLIIMQTK